MSNRYFLTTYTIKVLSEDDPVEDLSPREVAEEIDTGACVGRTETSSVEVTAEQMRELLTEFGSEPGFFRLDEDDNDWRCYDCSATGSRGEFDRSPEVPRCPDCNSIEVGLRVRDE